VPDDLHEPHPDDDDLEAELAAERAAEDRSKLDELSDDDLSREDDELT